MRYLANPSTPTIRAAMTSGLIGMVATPGQRQAIPDRAYWAADNGCFGTGYPGDPGWLAWLDEFSTLDERSRCMFATAPDVVGDAAATLDRSRPHLPTIRSLGFPAALVAQDGLEDLVVPWETFDVLFIGGSTDWKLGPAARSLVLDARRRGIPVHMGRVNSLRRLRYADTIGCSSADGTYFAFTSDAGLDDVERWIRELQSQAGLALWR